MTVATLSDGRIAELSGLACARKVKGVAFGVNDDPKSGPHFFGLAPANGATVGAFKVKGATFVDLEAIGVSAGGNITLGDFGDNDLERSTIAVWVLPEPTLSQYGSKVVTLKGTKYRLAYPNGRRYNAETLLVHPVTGAKFIVTKGPSEAHVFRLPAKLSRLRVNKLIPAGTLPLGYVTDGSFTPDGTHVLLRQKGVPKSVAVALWSTLELRKPIAVAAVKQPESISVEWDGKHFIYGSEGKKSPLRRDPVPDAYR